jgi:aspartyl-tRNA(Asn)/glutamyl-tRNA(Gln) amidotransferase subunit A
LDLCDRTADELGLLLGSGDIRPSEIVESAVRRTAAVEGALGSYLTFDADAALERAETLDRTASSGGVGGPLFGLPVAVKDNICTAGFPTTCASKMLEGYTPPYDATAVARLEAAGAVITGKTNLDEFGMGSSTEYSALGVTRNPWNTEMVPGGSSGGSAAAVCAGEAVIALGSDTGGSVRTPASFCGIVGMRPTYGLVSRYGLVAFASSLDQIGVMARDARGCALALSAIAGPDGRDATALPERGGHASGGMKDSGLSGARIGVPRAALENGLDSEVASAFGRAVADLERLGAKTVPVGLLDPSYSIAAYYVIADSEASTNLARYDGVRYGRRVRAETYDGVVTASRSKFLGREVRRRIMLGTFALSAGYYDMYYMKAVAARRRITEELRETLESVDCVATPTTATPAFAMGQKVDDPLEMCLTDAFTVAAPLAGLPAVSLPMGFTRSGMPLGLQLVGRSLSDLELLEMGQAYLDATGHNRNAPASPSDGGP